jgi:hypothetical protein
MTKTYAGCPSGTPACHLGDLGWPADKAVLAAFLIAIDESLIKIPSVDPGGVSRSAEDYAVSAALEKGHLMTDKLRVLAAALRVVVGDPQLMPQCGDLLE